MIKSDCYVTFEEYQEINPMLKGDNPDYKKMIDIEDNMMNFVMGLFG